MLKILFEGTLPHATQLSHPPGWLPDQLNWLGLIGALEGFDKTADHYGGISLIVKPWPVKPVSAERYRYFTPYG